MTGREISTPVTVVIPIFNDFESLKELISQIEIDSDLYSEVRVAFLVVNNGSTDSRIRETFAKSSGLISAIHLNKNVGFGGAIVAGANHSATDWIAWMPGNLKVHPRSLLEILQATRLRPGIAIKARRVGRPAIDQLKTALMGMVQSIASLRNMMDTGGTPTICEKAFLLSLSDPPSSVVFESFMLYKFRQAQLTVLRPECHYGRRKFGSSHWQKGIISEMRLAIEIIKGIPRWRKV